jgi:hypothetical protein
MIRQVEPEKEVATEESKVEHFGKERFIILFVKNKKKLPDSDIKTAEHVCMNDVWPIARLCAARQLESWSSLESYKVSV